MRGLKSGLRRMNLARTGLAALLLVKGNHRCLLRKLRRTSFLEDHKNVWRAVMEVTEPQRG